SLQQERLVQRSLRRPRARLGKDRLRRQAGLRQRLPPGLPVCGRQRLREQWLQARIVGEMIFDVVTLHPDARLPTRSLLARLTAWPGAGARTHRKGGVFWVGNISGDSWLVRLSSTRSIGP